MAQRSRPVMTLVVERRLSDLITPPAGSEVLEASGVVAKDGYYYVIFDNVRRVARVHPGLEPGSKEHGWFGSKREGDGYEDIAFSPHTRRFYLLIEAEKHVDGTYKGLIDECREDGRFEGRRWIDFPLETRNSGFEGLSAVRWKGRDYLLALCEGNRCRGGRKGRKPGGGRIQVLQRFGAMWKPIATIALPPHVKFEDYSAVSLRGTRIAVISQQTVEAVDRHAAIRRLDDCRTRHDLRLSEKQERQAEVLHARGTVLAVAAHLRHGVRFVERRLREALPEAGSIDPPVPDSVAARCYFGLVPAAARCSAARAALNTCSTALLPSWHAYSNIWYDGSRFSGIATVHGRV